jgi:hypothetical protein
MAMPRKTPPIEQIVKAYKQLPQKERHHAREFLYCMKVIPGGQAVTVQTGIPTEYPETTGAFVLGCMAVRRVNGGEK